MRFAELRFSRCEVLTFDCYGTLIDWESGILDALKPLLRRHGVVLSDEEILTLYGGIEPALQRGRYMKYRAVLAGVVAEFGRRLGFKPSPKEIRRLALSLENWKPFPDTVPALRRLRRRFKLAIISNVDRDLFAHTAKRLKIPFDWVTTAEEARAYKPSRRIFRLALKRMGARRDRLLHVGQSLYHDAVPARSLGITMVWVNRRKGKTGSGATAPARVQPDIEVPSLRVLADLML